MQYSPVSLSFLIKNQLDVYYLCFKGGLYDIWLLKPLSSIMCLSIKQFQVSIQNSSEIIAANKVIAFLALIYNYKHCKP